LLYEIRFHGRGGQGAAVAAQLLARAACLEGLWGQAFPFFGGERRGAPVTAFARLSDKPVRLHSQIYEPDAVLVFDPRLIEIVDVLKGLKKGGLLLLNSPPGSSPPEHANFFKTYSVDATSIAIRLGLKIAGWPVVNTAMLGAFARASELVSLEALRKAIALQWPGELGKLNGDAASIAYEEVSRIV